MNKKRDSVTPLPHKLLFHLLLVVTLLGQFIPLGWLGTVHADPPVSKVLPQLQRDATARRNETFRVIITRVNGNRGADNAAQAQGQKVRDLPFVDGFVLELPGRAIEALGRNPHIKLITPDAEVFSTDVEEANLGTLFNQTINSAGLWSPASGSSLTGAGIGVAVLDTGITERADWRGANGQSRVVANMLFNPRLARTDDGHGHGTHVAGIIAGNSWYQTSAALQGKYIGVAPEANLINVRVSDERGRSLISDVVSAIDWVVANRQTYNIRVMNLSLISSVPESYKTSVLAAAVERAWFNGIFVVVAAGNAGPNTMIYPPANDPFVITVGASDQMGTTSWADDTIAPWSSYGITQDGFIKPDVVAPGRYIPSPLASTASTLGVTYPTRIVDGSYIWMSGTSMAAPVVSGLAALAFQAHPEWTPDQVKWLLKQTANPLPNAQLVPQSQGAGSVNAAAVTGYALTPGFANQGLIINNYLVPSTGGIVYDSASWSTASWSTASWSTASWSTASWSTASWSTANESTASANVAQAVEVE